LIEGEIEEEKKRERMAVNGLRLKKGGAN